MLKILFYFELLTLDIIYLHYNYNIIYDITTSLLPKSKINLFKYLLFIIT